MLCHGLGKIKINNHFSKIIIFFFLNLLIALDTLSNGCTLYENQFIISSNGRFKAILQENAQFLVIVFDEIFY
jgi:hypothetical protein